jgi:hypothetical protein
MVYVSLTITRILVPNTNVEMFSVKGFHSIGTTVERD